MQREGLDHEEAAARLQDVLRFALVVHDRDHFGGIVQEAIERLRESGMQAEGVDVRFEKDAAYKGVHATLRAPLEDVPGGYVFELQFHTPESYTAKKTNHATYRAWADPGANAEKRAELEARMKRESARAVAPGELDKIERIAGPAWPLVSEADRQMAWTRYVENLLAQKREQEPKVTAWLDALAPRIGAQLVDLEHRLKSAEAILAKYRRHGSLGKRIKDENSADYARSRDEQTPAEEKAVLETKMRSRSSEVRHPPGVEGLKLTQAKIWSAPAAASGALTAPSGPKAPEALAAPRPSRLQEMASMDWTSRKRARSQSAEVDEMKPAAKRLAEKPLLPASTRGRPPRPKASDFFEPAQPFVSRQLQRCEI